MLAGLFGNSTAEKVLLYIANYGEGYASGIAGTFGIPKSQVRKQLIRLEENGILVGREVGNARMFSINPRFLLKRELSALLQRALDLIPRESADKYYRQRRRPRRTGQAL